MKRYTCTSTRRIAEALTLFGVFLIVAGAAPPTYKVSAIAGTADVGDGNDARLVIMRTPQDVAVNAAGHIYVAETNANRIRKITTGVISTVAGNGIAAFGGDGGQATAAQINGPRGIAIDASGNLYIADSGTHRIRKVATNGVITTVAGSGTAGYSGDGGSATLANLNGPSDVEVDASGNLYIADLGNQRIRKVTSGGTIGTIAGTGTAGFGGDGGAATSAMLNNPVGLALDGSGNLYIADQLNHRVRKVVLGSGVISTAAGTGTSGLSGDGGQATSAQLFSPQRVAINNSGELLIADSNNSRIRLVTAGGVISTIAGTNWGFSGDGGLATAAQLRSPQGMAMDAGGNLFIADGVNNRVRRVSDAGTITAVAGTSDVKDGGPASAAWLFRPEKVLVDPLGDMLIADGFNQRVRLVNWNGTISTFAGTGLPGFGGEGGPPNAADLFNPVGLATDNNSIYIVESGAHHIRKTAGNAIWRLAGAVITSGFSGDGGQAIDALMNSPSHIAVGLTGNVYFSDTANHRIRKITPGGIISTIAGTGTAGFSGDGGQATAANLNRPFGMCLDPLENLYFADQNNHRIRKITPSGVISTAAGTGVNGFTGDNGPATSADLSNPQDVACGSGGSLFIAATGNNRVRHVDTSGIIRTIAGDGVRGSSGDGGLATAAQMAPASVSVDFGGNVYISDRLHHRVRRLRPIDAQVPASMFRDTAGSIRYTTSASSTVVNGGGVFASDPSVAQNLGGDTLVVARDTFNAVWANAFNAATQTWGTWSYGGGVTKGVPAIAVSPVGTGYIAARDNWDSYWGTAYIPGVGFLGWVNLGGIFSQDPVITACADGSVYIIGTDTYNSLWSGRFIPGDGPGTGWQGWILGGGIIRGKPSVTCGTDNVAYVAVRDNWDSLWMARVQGNSWLGWSYGGGIMNGDPQVAASGTGTIFTVLRDAGNAVWYRGYTEGTSNGWLAWTLAGGLLTSASPSAVNGELYIVGRDTSNSLWWYRTMGNQWTNIGNTGIAAGGLSAGPR